VKITRKVQREVIVAAVLIGLAIITVSSVRRHLWATNKRIQNRHDVYFLPPPAQVERLSLGYKYALADVLWAHVLVSQGLHTFERRRFENLLRLYDTINLLDPKWRTPYLLADALITFQATTTPLNEVIKAREILERGVKNRPFDGEIWLNLGQFVSFVAPSSYIEDHDPELAAKWRLEGVPYLARAAELGAARANISWQALGGASILEKAGKREASIRFLKRTYAVTDDDELKEQILRSLNRLMVEREADNFRKRNEAFVQTYQSELPFINKNTALLLGPPLTPAACAGSDRAAATECATSWRQWGNRWQKEGPGD